MYLPRHYKIDKKKRFNWKAPLLGAFLIGIFLLLFFNRKEIIFHLGGNAPQKNSKSEKKLIDEYLSGKLKKETIAEFVTTSSSLLQSEPTLPRASHTMAKGFFYNLVFNGFEFNVKQLYTFVLEDQDTNQYFQKYGRTLNGMYRNALRAEIFQDNYPEKHSNQLLIVLNNILEGRINPEFVLTDLIKIDYERITPDLRRAYIWLSFITAINSGNQEELEIVFDRNASMANEGGMVITEREMDFFRGLTAYKKKEFVKALELLRKVKQDMDFVTVEAVKMEAMIFHLQNLNDKAIALLEDLNKQLDNSDPKVKARIAQIQSLKIQKK